MPSTLISLIGTAQLAPGEATYVTTIYDLPDGNRSRPVSLLAAAVQEQERCERVVFLGTRTSAWATLIDACCPDQVELFERLYAAQREPGGVPDDLLTATASAVGAMLRAEVACQALCLRDVDDGNAAGIIATMAAVIPDKGGIILDVTHAFRSIALLMLAALHLKDAVSPGVVARTEVQYGDLVTRPASKATEAKSGPAVGQGRVVALTSLTRAGALAGALTAAERSLDLDPLADLLAGKAQAACREVARALRSQAFDDLSIRALLDHLRRAATTDPLLAIAADGMERLLGPLCGHSLARCLLGLAKLAKDRGLWALAIFAAYEASCVYAVQGAKVQGIKELDAAWKASYASLPSADREALQRLEWTRNGVAHGADSLGRRRDDPKDILERALPVLSRRL